MRSIRAAKGSGTNMEQSLHAGKKHKKGKPPVIIPRHIREWAREQSTNSNVNNYKVGGGKKQK